MGVMEDVNPYAAPRHDLPLDALADEPGDRVWRDGNLLVIRKGAVLPDRCVKCNAPAEGGRLKVKLQCDGPIEVLGVRLPHMQRHAAKIEVCLCREHRRRRRIAVACGAFLFVVGAGATLIFVVGLFARPVAPPQPPVWPMALLMILLVASTVNELLFVRPVAPQKIDHDYVWLKKVDPGYLAQFPPFAAFAAGRCGEGASGDPCGWS